MSKFFTLFNRPPSKASCHGGKSLTDVSQLADTDINTIVRRYNAGDRSCVRLDGVFADVSQFGDYQHCLEVIRGADGAFASLPAAVRARFANDPAQLIAFLGDSKNLAEAVKLGLVNKPVTAPADAEVTPPAAVAEDSHLSNNSNSDTKKETDDVHA